VRVSAAPTKTGGDELRLRLTGYGYGKQLAASTAGELTTDGNRIEIKRAAITEWYVNQPEGLEQGFTLSTPPAQGSQGEWLRVELAVGDGWRAALRSDEQGAAFQRLSDELMLSYDHLLAYDAQGRTLPARMALEGATLALLVDDAQAVYPLTIDPILTQQQKLTAADGAADDNFGYAVALSGDTALVGAPFDDVSFGNRSPSAAIRWWWARTAMILARFPVKARLMCSCATGRTGRSNRNSPPATARPMITSASQSPSAATLWRSKSFRR
jgi:hypothetical protein